MGVPKTFEQRLSGRFENMLRWAQLDALWDVIRDGGEWYVYEVGHDVPEAWLWAVMSWPPRLKPLIHFCGLSMTKIIAALFTPTNLLRRL